LKRFSVRERSKAEQFIGKLTTSAALIAALIPFKVLKAQSAPHSLSEPESSAVDAKGVRHRMSDYGDKSAPGSPTGLNLFNRIILLSYRARHTEGTGLFCIKLNLKTGSVTDVEVLRSTGASGLDASAAQAIRQWRWRPERWKEINVPVTFTLRTSERYRGSARELADRATAHYRTGDNDAATTTLDELIRQQPKSVAAYITRGSAYQQKGEADKALADFNQAIRLDPKSARAHCDRGILEDVLLQQPNKALADYNEAIRLAPDFKRAYVNRGVHFLEQHDYERALPDFTRAIELIPNEPGTHGYRAYTYAKLRQRTPAQADAVAATRLKPAEMPLVRIEGLMVRADAYRILGKQELALRDYREAVRVMPNASKANSLLALFLATCPEDRFRNGTEAVSAARRACELSKWRRYDAIDTLAAAYAEAGDFDQAVKYEKQSLNDSSLAPKEKEEREKRLALFQQRKPFREDLANP
jgi:TonB family protein